MIHNSKELKEKEFQCLEEKFFNLLNELEIDESKEAIILLSRQLRGTVKEWQSSYGLGNLKEYITKEDQLEEIISKYPEIQNEYDNIINAYRFKKCLTTIELYNTSIQKVFKILRDLEPFFFISHVPFRRKSENLILISRFRYSIEVAKNYIRKNKGKFDNFADLIGFLTGYISVEVAPYCLQSRLKVLELIK